MQVFRTSRAPRPISIVHPLLRFSPQAYSASLRKGRFYASQSYGSGEGDPKGENPQEQGANPSESQEHPGPPSPNTAEGGQKTKQTSPSKSSSSSSENSGGPQPKIFNEKVPTEESEDVKKHNEDLSKRHDRPNAEVDVKGETVEKGFWKVNVA